MSLRARLAGPAGRIAYAAGLHRPALRDQAIVVVFHRVDDRYPGDPITLPVERFRAFCQFFARYFDVVRFGTLVDMLERREPLRGQLVISFDDGYRDNCHVAAPILESLGLPACFFVTTGLVGTATIPWWDRTAGIASEWMTWDEVRDLHQRGFEIGAHTVTHADLGVLSGEAARAEIEKSKMDLESRLEAPVTLFAYPYGRANQITEENRQLVRAAGFRCCPSAFGGLVRTADDPFHFRRLPVTGWYRSAGHLGLDFLRSR